MSDGSMMKHQRQLKLYQMAISWRRFNIIRCLVWGDCDVRLFPTSSPTSTFYSSIPVSEQSQISKWCSFLLKPLCTCVFIVRVERCVLHAFRRLHMRTPLVFNENIMSEMNLTEYKKWVRLSILHSYCTKYSDSQR